jgi:uncharacterized protein (DUF302 family)
LAQILVLATTTPDQEQSEDVAGELRAADFDRHVDTTTPVWAGKGSDQTRRSVEMSEPENGLITVGSRLSVREAIDRLLGEASSLGLQLFRRVDHAANAAHVGM